MTGALTVAALSVAIFAHKPMTAEEALLLKNVEAIAQGEDSGVYCTGPRNWGHCQSNNSYPCRDESACRP